MSWGGLVLRIALSLAIMPYVARKLGTAGYGEYLWLAAVFGYSAVLDFGFRAAILRYVGTMGARNEWLRVSDIVALILRYYAVIAVVLVAVGALLWRSSPASIQPPGASSSFFYYVFLSSLVAAAFFFRVAYQAIIQARERFDIASGIDILGTLTRAVFVVVALGRGGGVASVILADLAESLVCIVLGYVGALRIVPELRPNLFRRSTEDRKTVVEYGTLAFVNSLAFHLRFRAPNVIVGAVLDMNASALFGVATRVQSYLFQIGTAMNSPLRSRVAILDGLGDAVAIRRFVLLSSRVMAALAVALCSVFYFAAEELFLVWMGPEFVLSGTVLGVLLLAMMVEISQLVWVGTFYSIGKLGPLAGLSLVEGIVLSVVGFSVARGGDLLMATWGFTVPLLVTKLFFFPWLAGRTLRIPTRSLWWQGIARPYLCLLLIVPILESMRRLWSAASLLELALKLGVALGLSVLVLLFGAFDGRERAMTVDRVRTILARSRGGTS